MLIAAISCESPTVSLTLADRRVDREGPMATHDYHTLLVGYFHGQDNALKQEAIADRLGLSGQAHVSKLLKQARQMGYLREVFEFPPDVPQDMRREVENSYFS